MAVRWAGPRPGETGRVLLVQLSAMGDQVQTLPAVSDILARWPALRLHWAVDRRFAPRLRRPWPGSARLLRLLRVTKALRTPYDDVMLQLHDLAKADLDYQREAPQAAVDFAPGSTWVVFSDQVLHAVMGGQHMMEQTFYLHPDDQLVPQTSPLRVLERVLGRGLGVPARQRNP